MVYERETRYGVREQLVGKLVVLTASRDECAGVSVSITVISSCDWGYGSTERDGG